MEVVTEKGNDKKKKASSGDKTNLSITQLFCCQLRTNFDIMKPPLLPSPEKLKRKKSAGENSIKLINPGLVLSRKNSSLGLSGTRQGYYNESEGEGLTEETPPVPKLNLLECHLGSSSRSTNQIHDEDAGGVGGGGGGKNGSIHGIVMKTSDSIKSILPQLSARVISDLQNANDQAAKTLATIQDIRADVAVLKQKEVMSESELRSLVENKAKLDCYLNQFQTLTEKVKSVIDVDPTTEGNDIVLPLRSPKKEKVVEEINFDSPKFEDDDENLTPKLEKGASDIMLAATNRVKINAQLAAEMAKELGEDDEQSNCSLQLSDNVTDNIASECRTELVPFEGDLENFLNGAAPCLGVESVMAMTDRLSQTYQMQMLMANENKALEETRYELQEELIAKETEIENLQRKVEHLQTEMRVLQRENAALLEKSMKDRVAKPVHNPEVDVRRQKEIDDELGSLEREVQRMKLELTQLQTERQELLVTRQHTRSTLLVPQSVLRTMQDQIASLEKELEEAREAESIAVKEKEEVRKELQSQIDDLNSSLEQGQATWKSLYVLVQSLQNSLQLLKGPQVVKPPFSSLLEYKEEIK